MLNPLRSPTAWLLLAAAVFSAGHLWVFGRVDLTPTISLVEAEWTLTALVGCGYSAYFVADTLLDLRGPGVEIGMRLTAESLALLAGGFLIAHLVFLSLGASAVLRPPSPDSAGMGWLVYGITLTVSGQAIVAALAAVQHRRSALLQLSPALAAAPVTSEVPPCSS